MVDDPTSLFTILHDSVFAFFLVTFVFLLYLAPLNCSSMQHPSYRIIIDNDHKASSSSSSSSTAPFPTCTLSRVPRVPRASSPRPTMVPPVKDPYRRHRSTLPPASPPAIPPRSLARPDALLINTQEQTPSLNPQSPTLVATLATDTDATATTATSLAITVQPLTRKEVKECKICFEEFEWISLLHLQHPEEAPPLPPSPPTSPEVVEDDAVDLGSIEFDLAEQQVILQEIQQQRQQQRQSSSSSSSSSSSQPPLDPPSISLSTTSSSSSLSSHTSSWDETSSPSSFSSSSLPRPLSTLPPLSSIAPPTSSSSHQHSTAGGTKSRHPLASLFTRYKNRSSGGNNPLGIYYSSSPSGHSRSVVDLPIFKYSAFRVGRPDPSPRPPTPEFSVTLRASTFPLSPASSPPPSPPSKTPEAMKLGGSLPCGQDHLFCFECLSRHVATQVQARAWPVLCPAENCREAIEDPFLIEMFLGGEANLWHSTAMEYAVKDKIYCPQTTCGRLIDGGGDHSQDHLREVNCPYCDYQFCALCSDKSHPGMTCEALKASKNIKEADLAFEKLCAEHKWKTCPGCKHMVEKTQGCNHMTCRCGHQFCYACTTNSKWPCSTHRS